MFRKAQYLAISVIAVSLSGGAIAGEGMKHQKDNAATFSKLDTDNNGMLSEAEVRAMDARAAGSDTLSEKWNELDTNQDGELDQSEFARFEPTGDEMSGRTTADDQYREAGEKVDQYKQTAEDQYEKADAKMDEYKSEDGQ